MAKKKARKQEIEPCMICQTGNVAYKVVGIGDGIALTMPLDHVLQDGEMYLGNMCARIATNGRRNRMMTMCKDCRYLMRCQTKHEFDPDCTGFKLSYYACYTKITALEAQLAEANSKLDKYSGMCVSCPDMGMTLVVERLEQELAGANEAARRIQTVDTDWKWRDMITKLQEYAYHYGDDALAEQLDVIEIELLTMEARIQHDGEVIDDEREAARLQVALDRIEAAGFNAHSSRIACRIWPIKTSRAKTGKSFGEKTRAEAAEAAAQWAESQKEGEA